MTLSDIYKKISLNKCIEQDELEDMISEFFKNCKEHMKNEDFQKIRISNFGSFVPSNGIIKNKIRKYEKYISSGIHNKDTIENMTRVKELLEKNLNKQFKHKRNDNRSNKDNGAEKSSGC